MTQMLILRTFLIQMKVRIIDFLTNIIISVYVIPNQVS